MTRPALICLTASSLDLARRVRASLSDAEIHGLSGRVAAPDVVTFSAVADHLRGLFAAGRPIVGICAAGILIRVLAPLLDDKQDEPPLLALAEDGSAVVPLLGGHRGANDLARTIAAALGATAAITTAGDLRLGFALDRPPAGWRIENEARAKPAMASLLAGDPVGLAADCGDLSWLDATRFTQDAPTLVRVTDRTDGGDGLILRPPTLALGVGCSRAAPADELLGLARYALRDAGYSEKSVACVVSLDLKEDEPAVQALAAHLGVPARFFPAEHLLRETDRLSVRSEVVFQATGCYGVAEGAALAAIGVAGALVAPKRKSANATVAIGRLAAGLDGAAVGRAQGTLHVVGIGPGAADWRTGEAVRVLSQADEIVGYQLYLDLVADLVAGKSCHAAPLGAETERVERALDLAASGRKVALISSGDAGIYGLASLVMERIDRGGRADWRRVALTMVPGLSALLAAASRLGAPLGHDFCAISLSDLLTPWTAIEKRLHAAAAGDFVVALYNPRAQRRAWQLPAALAILAASRLPDTPVAVARNLGRADERIHLATIATLDPDSVDMLSLVMIGSSETRRVGERIYTPRGYGGRDAERKSA